MKVIIGFSKARSPYSILSKAIRLVEGTKFSHIYIRLPSLDIAEEVIYQASGLKVNMECYKAFDHHAIIVEEYELEISDEALRKTWKFALQNAGISYGSKELVGFIWVKLCALFGKKVDNPFRDGRATYVCSELVAYILEDCLDIETGDPENMTPKEMNKIMKFIPGAVRTV